jgi:hypothetical protein
MPIGETAATEEGERRVDFASHQHEDQDRAEARPPTVRCSRSIFLPCLARYPSRSTAATVTEMMVRLAVILGPVALRGWQGPADR